MWQFGCNASTFKRVPISQLKLNARASTFHQRCRLNSKYVMSRCIGTTDVVSTADQQGSQPGTMIAYLLALGTPTHLIEMTDKNSTGGNEVETLQHFVIGVPSWHHVDHVARYLQSAMTSKV